MGSSESGDSKAFKRTYFSVSYELIITGNTLPFDLYVNSSGHDKKVRFVRVFPKGQELTDEDVHEFKTKYPQLYVPESQRNIYMQSLVQSRHFSDTDKGNVVKSAAIDYLDRLFELEREFSTEVLVATIEGCREVVENMVDVVEDQGVEGLQNLIGSLSFHDFYTYDHSINVSMYCISIYKLLYPKATREEMMNAGLGGLLHDLGKIKVPTEILNSPDRLTDEQFAMIKQHPDFGLDLIKEGEHEISADVNLQEIKRVVHEHHENWDGTGYPSKLAGEDISELSRICAIADFFDAVTTKRSYSDVMSVDQALKIMAKTKGKKLDPEMFDKFAAQFANQLTREKFDMQMAEDFDSERPYKKFPLIPADSPEEVSYKDDKGKTQKSGKVNLFGAQKKQQQPKKSGRVNLFGGKKKTG
jgi:HD-GYP domain-containing protein (c-di-GMP phosphodiesterase class II)